jgi:hypothetical protein
VMGTGVWNSVVWVGLGFYEIGMHIRRLTY